MEKQKKKIELCIGTDRAGGVRARLSLLLMNGERVESERYHSVNLLPGDDASSVRARVEMHLAMPFERSGIPDAPWPAIPDEEWAKVTTVLAVFHTPEMVQKRLARMAETKAEEEKAIRTAKEQEAAAAAELDKRVEAALQRALQKR